VSHLISSVSHLISSELNGAEFVVLGLAAWAWAYWFLTRVITPDSISDLMTLIAAVLPPFSILIAGAVAIVSFAITPRHIIQGIVFVVIALLAGFVTRNQYKESDIRDALTQNVVFSRPFWSTIRLICLGSFGAILVFASEPGLVFGGWLFIHGSILWGWVWAGSATVISVLGTWPDSPKSILSTWPDSPKNPLRKCVKALKGDDTDRSVRFIKRLLVASGRLQNTSSPAVRA
jgi:hypothetical protein